MRLDVRQTHQDHSADLVGGAFDVIVLCGSWDSRCKLIVESPRVTAALAIVFTYPAGMYSGTQLENQSAVLLFAKGAASHVELRDAGRTSPEDQLEGLIQAVSDMSTELRRPLRILIDLVGLSRYVSLGLLAWGLQSGTVAQCTFLYASAFRYEERLVHEEPGFVFRAGNWLPSAIPGLGRPVVTGSKQCLAVSVGFEGRRTKRLVDLLEPDELIAISPTSKSVEINAERDAQLSYLMDVGSIPSVVDLDVLDVAGAAAMIAGLADERTAGGAAGASMMFSVLLAGPKSLSLATAIAAMRSQISNVFYVRSDRHEEVDAVEVGERIVVTVSVPWSAALLPERDGAN